MEILKQFKNFDIPNIELIYLGVAFASIESRKGKYYLHSDESKEVIETLLQFGYVEKDYLGYCLGDVGQIEFFKKFAKKEKPKYKQLIKLIDKYETYCKSTRKQNEFSKLETLIRRIVEKFENGTQKENDYFHYISLCLAARREYSNIALVNPSHKEKAVVKKLISKISNTEFLDFIPYFCFNYKYEPPFTELNLYAMYYKFDTLYGEFKIMKWY